MMFADTSRGKPFSKDPAVVRLGNRYLLYYSIPPFRDGREGDGWRIGVAEGMDLDCWEKVGELPPLSPCDNNGMAAPGAIVLDGRVHLFYTAYGNGPKDAICHAVSADGIRFTPNESNPVFSPTGSWNCGRAIDPDVIEHDGRLLLYFSTRDPEFKVQMTGVAAAPLSSSFGRADWTQLCHAPILAPELPWEQDCIEASALCRHDGKLYMFYGGAYNNAPQQIGCAVSDDGLNWKRVSDTPVLANGAPGEWNSSESGHPFVFESAAGVHHLFFQGNNDNGDTWYISRREIAWGNGIPYCKPYQETETNGKQIFSGNNEAQQGRSFLTPNDFQGTDTERINQAIKAAAAAGCRVVIPRTNLGGCVPEDRWLLDSAILLESNTVLELDNCHIKLSNRCRDNFIRGVSSSNSESAPQPLRNIHIRGVGRACLEGADRPRATGDSGKTIGAGTYGTDAGVDREKQYGDWRNIGILLGFVQHFSIENLLIKDSHCWGISLEYCAHGKVRDIEFSSDGVKVVDDNSETVLNQDGLDLRRGCHDILIENISGRSGDDLVALTALPGRKKSGMVGTAYFGEVMLGDGLDDIRHIVVRNIRGYSAGGHHIVRLLNSGGIRMHDILIDGVVDCTPAGVQPCRATLKIGDHNYGDGAAAVGETCRIVVNNVISKAVHAVLIGGSLSDSIVTNVVHHSSDGVEALSFSPQSGRDCVCNVRLANLMTAGIG
ncbi:MAG: family 43 glycosylhydrolase [Kiritimatiellales bacterium]|nr:family 43 glycosylhydrolase [Kiritimatiellales bacterium]